MKRRGFLGKLLKGAAVVTVAPMAIASIVPAPVASSIEGFTSYLYGERTFHVKGHPYFYYQGVEEAVVRHKAIIDRGIYNWFIPQGNGKFKIIKMKP